MLAGKFGGVLRAVHTTKGQVAIKAPQPLWSRRRTSTAPGRTRPHAQPQRRCLQLLSELHESRRPHNFGPEATPVDLERELVLLQRLSHPNLARFYGLVVQALLPVART